MRAKLLYDADCGFCTKAAGRVPSLRLDVDVMSLQSVDLESLGVVPERAEAELPLVEADGTVRYGSDAIAGALLTGPLPARIAGRFLGLTGVRSLARPIYRWVARHRHRLPGGTAACALPSAD